MSISNSCCLLCADEWPSQYSSVFERLRFAQASQASHISASLTTSVEQLSSGQQEHRVVARRGARPGRYQHRQSTSSLPGLQQRRDSSSLIRDDQGSWFLTSPERPRRRDITASQRIEMAMQRRKSMLADISNERVYQASKRKSWNRPPTDDVAPRLSSIGLLGEKKPAVQGLPASKAPSSSLHENFRWMDEETDLNLKLVLDDYHANLDGAVLPRPSSTLRPSFRRHMSISKAPFGRVSASALNSKPLSPPRRRHSRQKSKTLSLVVTKHNPQTSVSSIEQDAAHYQDPEARQKLRLYLATPQNFDEAIEFGFPSTGHTTDELDKENSTARLSQYTLPPLDSPTTFFHESVGSLCEDDGSSMKDPDSPLTPISPTSRSIISDPSRPGHTSTRADATGGVSDSSRTRSVVRMHLQHSKTEPYTYTLPGSREMTLRMTLTRPDLRADDSIMYPRRGQSDTKIPIVQRSTSSEEPHLDKNDKLGPFGGVDGWGSMEKDGNVVKRLWNKVLRTQRKIAA